VDPIQHVTERHGSWLGLVGLNVSNDYALWRALTYGEPVTLLYHRRVGGASFLRCALGSWIILWTKDEE